MKGLFVPYNLTLELERLGFICSSRFSFYIREDDTPHSKSLQRFNGAHHFISEHCIVAPLWQEAFDWFEKFNIYAHLNRVCLGSDEWGYRFIIDYLPKEFQDYKRRASHFITIDSFEEGAGSYEGAWYNKNEARQKCLEKLIELGSIILHLD